MADDKRLGGKSSSRDSQDSEDTAPPEGSDNVIAFPRPARKPSDDPSPPSPPPAAA